MDKRVTIGFTYLGKWREIADIETTSAMNISYGLSQFTSIVLYYWNPDANKWVSFPNANQAQTTR